TGLGSTNCTIKNSNISTGVGTGLNYGVAVSGATIGTSGADNDNITIQNNAITVAAIGIYANGTASTSSGGDDSLAITGNSVGYSSTITTTAGGINLYFNSVNMYGDHSYTSATNTAALYVGTGASGLDVRNNIFANSLNNTTTAGSKDYCVYSVAANTAFTDI